MMVSIFPNNNLVYLIKSEIISILNFGKYSTIIMKTNNINEQFVVNDIKGISLNVKRFVVVCQKTR